MKEPVRLSADRFGNVPAGYILCTDTKHSSGAFAERARADTASAEADPEWGNSEFDTSHEALILTPKELTTALQLIVGAAEI